MNTTMVLAAMAGLFCLLAVLLLAGLVVYNSRRGKTQESPRGSVPTPATSPAPQPLPAPNPLAAVGAQPGETPYDEEEMPTVVVNQPERPPPGPRPMAAAPQRSSGATIIAFDEEEEEENG